MADTTELDECKQQTSAALAHLANRAMAQELAAGECIDLKDCPRTITGEYVLPAGLYREDVDYCDSSRNAWIWSIALLKRPLPSRSKRNEPLMLESGTYIASPSARLYQMAGGALKCVWLR